MPFIVLSSSRGTTFQSVIDRLHDGSLTDTCVGLVTDRDDRACLEKAKKAKIPFVVVPKREGETREAYDARMHRAIMELLSANKVDPADITIAAMGWMFIMGPEFIERWKGRIINVHPALLPKHGGPGMYGLRVHQEVINAGDIVTGITIHLVDQGVDTGKILLQKTCPVLPTDTPEVLQQRVQELEKEWYPLLLQGRVQ